jgi:hypothetical protein
MTDLMRQAIDKVVKLPDSEQDALAAILLAEMESERRWDELFARPESHDLLSRLADRALESHVSGRSRKLDLGEL